MCPRPLQGNLSPLAMSERGSTGQPKGTALSAEVEPFVPKQRLTEVGVQWPEPSSSVTVPGYLMTCYPFVQDPYVIHKQHLWKRNDSCRNAFQTAYPSADYSVHYSREQLTSDSTLKPYVQISAQCDLTHSSKHKYSGNTRGSQQKQFRQPDIEKERPCSTPSSSKEARSKKELRNQEQNIQSVHEIAEAATGEHRQRTALIRDNTTKSEKNQFNGPQHNKSKPLRKIQNVSEPKTSDTFKVALSDFPLLQSTVRCDIRQCNYDLKDSQVSTPPSSEGSQQTSKLRCTDNTTNTGEELGKAQRYVFSNTQKKCSAFGLATITETSKAQPTVAATPPTSSWASIVSQTPRRPVASSASPKAPASNIAKVGDQQEMQSEVGEQSKTSGKTKRKKKKSNVLDAVPKPEETKITVQELPRFEDDEEFPDLASAKSNSDKASTPGQNKILHYNQGTRSQSESFMNGALSVTESCAAAPDVDQKPVQILRKESAADKVPRSAQKIIMEAPKKSGKKSKIPVKLDFGNMLAVLEQRQQEKTDKQTPKAIVFTVGGALVPKDSTTSKRQPQHLNRDKMPHNPLDSSAPLVKRGKQREVPKAKKPTPLKKIILKEREERKQRCLLEEKGLIPPSCNIAPHPELDSEENTNTDTENVKAELNDSAEDLFNFTSSPSEENLQSISDIQKTSEETNTADVLVNPNRPKIHSRRFREYCSQVLSKDVDSCVTDLLKELVRFQDRLYQKDPIKAKKKRRIVMGLREVLKHLKLKRLKCIIISPNCEKIQSRGGLDDALHNIIRIACEQEIPFVFALNRKALGQCVNKPVPVSVLGIFSYDGAENQFHQMVEITEEARKAYQEMLDALEQELETDEERGDSQEHPLIPSEDSTVNFNNVTSQPSEADEPKYVTTWRNLLKNQCNPSL